MDDAGLDNPFFAALAGIHRDVALRRGEVARYPADVAPFLGVAHAEVDVGDAFDALVPAGDEALLLGVVPARMPPGWALEPFADLAQMVREEPLQDVDGPDILELGERHRADVLALTALVYPHYFRPRATRSAAFSGFSDMPQTPRTTSACLTASLAGGVFAAIVASLLWPVFLWLSDGELNSPAWAPQNILFLLLFVAAFAGVTATFFGALIGFPTLVLLERSQFNRPWVAGIIGAAFAAVGFFVIWIRRGDWTALAYWKPLAYLMVIGAAQGTFSSLFLQRKR